MFLINVFLMLAWTVLSGEYTVVNIIIGFALGYLVLSLTVTHARTTYFKRAPKTVNLFFYFLWQLTKSNVRVALEVITPQHHMRPGIIAMPLDVKTDLGIVLLSSLVTLTPGSLSLEVSADKKILYIHEMYIESVEEAVKLIKEGFERRIIEVFES